MHYGDHRQQMFENLARENAEMLMSYLRALVLRGDTIEDLFQETMLTAWRRFESYDSARPFSPWLRGIASRIVLKHRERYTKDVFLCRPDPDLLESLNSRFDTMAKSHEDFEDLVDQLRRCLGELSGRIHDAIDLAYRDGFKFRQIAERLGSSEEAVKKRIQRGRQLLADCIRAARTSE